MGPPFGGPSGPGGNSDHPGFGNGPGGPPGSDILSTLMKGKPHLFGPMAGGAGSGAASTWEAVSDLLNFNTDWMADYVTEYLNELEGGPAPRDLANMVRNSGP